MENSIKTQPQFFEGDIDIIDNVLELESMLLEDSNLENY